MSSSWQVFAGLGALIAVGGVVAACDRAPSPPTTQRKVAEPVAAQTSVAPKHETADLGPWRYPAAERLIAVGDLHGDLAATRAALKLSGAIDDADHWVGGKLVLVQTGDEIDRGDDDRAVIDLLDSLAREAESAGGRVVALNGNHETMNAQGDFRYVTPGALAFGEVNPVSPHAASAPERFRQRAAAFLPGGEYAKVLARRPIVAVVGDSVFAHGGVLPEHVDHGIAKMNREVTSWLLGEVPGPPRSVASEDAPVWTRAYGAEESTAVCEAARRVFAALGVRRLVVGHTVQKLGISSICDGSVWRIDVGMAAYYGQANVSVLEIKGGHVRALTAPK